MTKGDTLLQAVAQYRDLSVMKGRQIEIDRVVALVNGLSDAQFKRGRQGTYFKALIDVLEYLHSEYQEDRKSVV